MFHVIDLDRGLDIIFLTRFAAFEDHICIVLKLSADLKVIGNENHFFQRYNLDDLESTLNQLGAKLKQNNVDLLKFRILLR